VETVSEHTSRKLKDSISNNSLFYDVKQEASDISIPSDSYSRRRLYSLFNGLDAPAIVWISMSKFIISQSFLVVILPDEDMMLFIVAVICLGFVLFNIIHSYAVIITIVLGVGTGTGILLALHLFLSMVYDT